MIEKIERIAKLVAEVSKEVDKVQELGKNAAHLVVAMGALRTAQANLETHTGGLGETTLPAKPEAN